MLFNNEVTHDVDEFNRFDDPMGPSVPLARWERKAASSSHRSASTSKPTSSTSSRIQSRNKTPTRNNKTPQNNNNDRFIPNRSTMDIDICRMNLSFPSTNKENSDSTNYNHEFDTQSTIGNQTEYTSALASSLLTHSHSSSSSLSLSISEMDDSSDAHHLLNSTSNSSDKILSFRNKAPLAKEGYVNSLKVLYSQNAASHNRVKKKQFRHISQNAEKILDAPDLIDDYYLNLLDWNASNVLAVALGNIVYLWNASTSTIQQLCEMNTSGDSYITSVSWMNTDGADSCILAVGTSDCDLFLYETTSLSLIRNMKSHSSRVSSLSWNGPILSSGSRDSNIHHHDVRVREHHVGSFFGTHSQEICGLKWSPNGTQLASGGNDNLLCIWDSSQIGLSTTTAVSPRHVLRDHTAAVKAIAWCPWQNGLLASGGGTADRMLRFWNSMSGVCVNSVDTKSQVCSIVWNPHDKELVTSHGFLQNQLTVWKYPSVIRMAELTGHTSRVLHTALSSDGQTIVSAAADETLRF